MIVHAQHIRIKLIWHLYDTWYSTNTYSIQVLDIIPSLLFHTVLLIFLFLNMKHVAKECKQWHRSTVSTIILDFSLQSGILDPLIHVLALSITELHSLGQLSDNNSRPHWQQDFFPKKISVFGTILLPLTPIAWMIICSSSNISPKNLKLLGDSKYTWKFALYTHFFIAPHNHLFTKNLLYTPTSSLHSITIYSQW